MPTIQEIKLADLNAELVAVKGAISSAYSGQEFEIEGGGSRRRLKRQPIAVLLARKREIEAEILLWCGYGSNRVSHGVAIS